MSGEALGHAGEGLWDPSRSYEGHRETCNGGNSGCPGPPLSILDASKQITDKLDNYQTGAYYLSRRVGRRIIIIIIVIISIIITILLLLIIIIIIIIISSSSSSPFSSSSPSSYLR